MLLPTQTGARTPPALPARLLPAPCHWLQRAPGPAATLPMLRSCRAQHLLFREPLSFPPPQTPGGIPCCQLLSWHDDPSFPEIRDGERRSPSCIPLHCRYLENCRSHQRSMSEGGLAGSQLADPPGSLQGGSRNNQALPFSGAFQPRISKIRRLIRQKREQLAGERLDAKRPRWLLTPQSSGPGGCSSHFCSTLGLTLTCLPLP